MSTYLLRDIPKELHRRLRRIAKDQGVSMRRIVLEGIKQQVRTLENTQAVVRTGMTLNISSD